MTSLQPYQQQILDAITSGARPLPLWTSGRRMGKSWRAKLVREYCEAHGIRVVEMCKDGIRGADGELISFDEWNNDCTNDNIATSGSDDAKKFATRHQSRSHSDIIASFWQNMGDNEDDGKTDE